MLDDAGNLRRTDLATKRHEDVRLGRATWVWAWLALELDGRRFAALQRQARATARGELPAAVLGERLAELLGDRGRREAEAELERALAALQSALGAHPGLDRLRGEIDRLLVSYE
jgi:hypothetical protein